MLGEISLLMTVVKFVISQGPAMLTALMGVLSALIALFMLIPGPHPEDWLQGALDFLSKFSRKP